jgi:hypothetical protein
MSDNRQSQFSQSREPRFAQGESVQSLRVPSSVSRSTDQQTRADQQARARAAEFAGNDSSFVQFGQLVPVVFPGIGIPVAILSFVVPAGRVLIIKSVRFWLSEPFAYINDQFGWRLTVNNGQMPFHSSFNTLDVHTFKPPMPGADSETPMFPINVQQNATVNVEFDEIRTIPVGPTPFESYLAASCWLFGELLKPGGVS